MSSASGPTQAAKIVLSYAHQDKRLKDKLLAHLKPMMRQRLIESWDDQQIRVGDTWHEEIIKRFNEANIILCLISSDFIASDYCYNVEMQHALEKRERGEVEVIPILLREVDWQKTPFHKIQVLPRNGKSIASRSSSNQERALVEVAKEIEKVVDFLSMRSEILKR